MYDVAVICAGPAGSVAASFLAQARRKVIFFDRAEFPRDKPCGDLVAPEAVDILRQVGAGDRFDQYNFFPIYKARIMSTRKRWVELPFERAGYISPRTAFDELLRQNALCCGATFCHLNITAPLLEDGRVIGVRGRSLDGKSTSTEIRARITIVADGSSSSIGRALGLDKQERRHTGVAVRAYLEMSELDHVLEGYLLSEFMPGYAWIFPVNKQLANVGIGTRADVLKRKRLSLLQSLQHFLCSPDIRSRIPDINKLHEPKAWMLQYGSQPRPRVYPGAIFIGDAGSFVNPLTGDGIFPAMLTARLAAQVALSSLECDSVTPITLTQFERLWKEVLAWPTRRDYFFQRLMEVWPSAADTFIKYWQSQNKDQSKTYSWFSQKLIPFG
jgi:menaquinone-9 beta-reductase